MKPSSIARIVEKLVWHLRKENIYVVSCEIREKPSKFEVYMKLDRNMAGVEYIKIILGKNNSNVRVFTGKTGFDLRIKKFIKRELESMAKKP